MSARGLGQMPQQAKNHPLSGKKNRWFCQSGYQVALLAHLLFTHLFRMICKLGSDKSYFIKVPHVMTDDVVDVRTNHIRHQHISCRIHVVFHKEHFDTT